MNIYIQHTNKMDEQTKTKPIKQNNASQVCVYLDDTMKVLYKSTRKKL